MPWRDHISSEGFWNNMTTFSLLKIYPKENIDINAKHEAMKVLDGKIGGVGYVLLCLFVWINTPRQMKQKAKLHKKATSNQKASLHQKTESETTEREKIFNNCVIGKEFISRMYKLSL